MKESFASTLRGTKAKVMLPRFGKLDADLFGRITECSLRKQHQSDAAVEGKANESEGKANQNKLQAISEGKQNELTSAYSGS